MSRRHQLDGFQLVSGLLGVIFGPLMLATDYPVDEACILIVAGTVILLTQWSLVADLIARRDLADRSPSADRAAP
jgi:uncharacterized membrane protein HdeD (DUF308 family)